MALCNCNDAGRNRGGSTPLTVAGTVGRIGSPLTIAPQFVSIDMFNPLIDRGVGLLSRWNTQPYATLKLLPTRNDNASTPVETDRGLIFAKLL